MGPATAAPATGAVPTAASPPPPVPGQTGPAQMVMPSGPAAPGEPPGMWGQIKGFLGKTAGDFVESMGDTPEERQQNLQMFTEAISTMNGLGAKLGQSTLMQRMGQKRGAEMVEEWKNQPPPQPMPPMNRLSPSDLDAILGGTNMKAAQDIQEATRWGK